MEEILQSAINDARAKVDALDSDDNSLEALRDRASLRQIEQVFEANFGKPAPAALQ